MTDNLKLIILDAAIITFVIIIIIILLILKHKENKKNMNEELTPLKALEILKKRQWVYIEQYNTLCEYIETALKDYEKKTKLAKEYADVNNVAKRLKALEIIKEIIPVEKEDFFYDKETDTYFFIGHKVSKEQFDLLREVLL